MHTLHLRNLLGRVALAALLPLALPACDDGGSSDSSGSDSDSDTEGDDDDDDSSATATVTVTDTTPTTMTDSASDGSTTDDSASDTDDTSSDTDDSASDTDDSASDTDATTGDTDGTTGETDGTTGETDGTTGETDGTTGTTLECAEANLGDDSPISVTDDNTGAGDDITLSCSGDGGGEEVIYEYTSGVAGFYRFSTDGSELDTAIALLDGCEGSELACNDDISALGGNYASSITVNLEADTDYVAVVDSYGGEVGEYTLTVDYLSDTGLPQALCDAAGEDLVACDQPGMNMMGHGDTLSCNTMFISYDIYEVEVTEGDCIYLRADNIDPVAGATGMESGDLRMLVFDANGDVSGFDDEIDCTDPTFGGDFGCPEANITASSTGTMTVIIGMYGGEDCPDGAPYTFDAAINGTDIDVSGGPAMPEVPGLCG